MENRIQNFFEKTGRAYSFIAITILSVIVLILLINFFAFIGVSLLKSSLTSGPFSYSPEMFKEIYPNSNYSAADIKQLLTETWGRDSNLGKIVESYQYSEFSQFVPKPRTGKFVNVDVNGFRKIKNQCPYSSNNTYNIFVFGGSTTFSVSVADDETYSSYLQEVLRVKYNRTDICVYNFGVSFYYSSEEMLLFESLLLRGQRPNMVIFMDGLNEGRTEFGNTQRLTDFMAGKNIFLNQFSDTSFFRGLKFLQDTFAAPLPTVAPEDVQQFVTRYETNRNMRKALADVYNITAYFVIQPIPVYNYNLSYDTIWVNHKDTPQELEQRLYEAFAKKGYSNGSAVIWLADIQKNEKRNLYADWLHYNGPFSRTIAEDLAARIELT